MARNPRIVLPSNLYDAVEDVPEYVLGRVFKMCFIYCLDADTIMYPQQQAFEMWNTDPYVRQVFKFFKQYLDESIDTYRRVSERNRINGRRGGRPKKIENCTEEELRAHLDAIANHTPRPTKKKKKKEEKPIKPVMSSFIREIYPAISNSDVYSYSEPVSIPKDYPRGYYFSEPSVK